jgi:hypothetical protein
MEPVGRLIRVFFFPYQLAKAQGSGANHQKQHAGPVQHSEPFASRRSQKGSTLHGTSPSIQALRRQPLKQSAGGPQIRGRETFSEPIINRCKRCSRLAVATLAHPQTGNAEGDPQLPK